MTDDRELQDAYRSRPAVQGVGDPPDPETMRALAEGSYVGQDRDALLERVLAHPDFAREFHFLADVAASRRPARSMWTSPRTLALAAGAVLAVALATRLALPPSEEPMRGDTVRATGLLIDPAEGAQLAAPSVRFSWHRVPGAAAYEIAVADSIGAPVLAESVTDTTWVSSLPAGRLTWWVTARFADGTNQASPVRELLVAPPRP